MAYVIYYLISFMVIFLRRFSLLVCLLAACFGLGICITYSVRSTCLIYCVITDGVNGRRFIIL